MQDDFGADTKKHAGKTVIVETSNLKKWFPVRKGLLDLLKRRATLCTKAVDGIDLRIFTDEILGLVGESGCGKTTVGRLLTGLIRPTDGKIWIEGQELLSIKNRVQKIQMIFQDPYEYLSPWSTIENCLMEPLQINRVFDDKRQESDRMKEMMKLAGLLPIDNFLSKYPFELSGGERQRVMIARAFMLNPQFVVADEPVSMLDASIRCGVLNLMLDLKEEYRTSFLFITHDLAVARYMCDRIAVMYLGKIVEIGAADEVTHRPFHPYSKALIAAVPEIHLREEKSAIPIKGDIQTALDLPKGCRFHPRCPYAQDMCREEEPDLVEVSKGHFARCSHL